MARRELTSSFVRMVLRGAAGRCPRCGRRGWFRRWFHAAPRCPTCGYRYERQEGFMLGAMTMNVLITFALLAVLLVVGTVVTYPDLPVLELVVIGLGIALVWPLFFYPMSYTLWAAVDLLMHPLEAHEVADADAHANPAWLAERPLPGA